MRLMRRTKQGLTAAAVLALISGGGVAVLTNNAMTRQIDQMAAKHGIDLNTAETGQMLTNTFKSSYAKACGVLSQFGIVPEDIAKKAAKEAANFSANMYNSMPDGQDVQNQIQNAVGDVADESEIEKQMQDIADVVLKETPAEDAKKNKSKKILFFKIFSILNVEQKKKLKFCSEREARAERL